MAQILTRFGASVAFQWGALGGVRKETSNPLSVFRSSLLSGNLGGKRHAGGEIQIWWG